MKRITSSLWWSCSNSTRLWTTRRAITQASPPRLLRPTLVTVAPSSSPSTTEKLEDKKKAPTASIDSDFSETETEGVVETEHGKRLDIVAGDPCDIYQYISTSGMEWIDIRGKQNEEHKKLIGSDAQFVAASRKVLRQHGVPRALITEARNVFAMPQTVRHSDQSFCVMIRFVLTPHTPNLFVAPESALTDRYRGDEANQYKDELLAPGVSLSRANFNRSSSRRFEIEHELSKELKKTRKENVNLAAKDGKRAKSLFHLTGRLTIFVLKKERRIITVHRQPFEALGSMRQHWFDHYKHKTMEELIIHCIKSCALSFVDASRDTSFTVDALESMLFDKKHQLSFAECGFLVYKLHALGREQSVYNRILKPMRRAFDQVVKELKIEVPQLVDGTQTEEGAKPKTELEQKQYVALEALFPHLIQDAESTISRAAHGCDELHEQIVSLLSIHFSAVSYQIEDLMKIMTVYSTIFIPLSFVAAAFGMNFAGMLPLYEDPYGVVLMAGLMAFSGFLTMVWLRTQRLV